jgi:hypothetical protein
MEVHAEDNVLMSILSELLDRTQLMDILVGVENLVELFQIGDDVLDGNMMTYALSEIL